MREEEANWFARWEDELPSPEELMPLSQTLITPDLALAFDIPTSSPAPHPPPPPPDFDAAAADDAARTLKRPRLVWTPQLHKRFVDAVAQLGIKTAVPKTIMQLMSVDGLTRENVASHLQKYRLYLKRMKGAAGGSAGGGISAADHQLFATAAAPVPHHFLNRGAAPAFSPYASALQQQHHQLAAQQYYQQRQAGQFGMPMGSAGFEHAFLARPQLGVHRMLGAAALGMVQTSSRPEEQDLVSGGGGGRRELTLFPTADV